jgi:hypothetical protein
MISLRRLAGALLLAGVLSCPATAQVASAPIIQPSQPTRQVRTEVRRPVIEDPQSQAEQARRRAAAQRNAEAMRYRDQDASSPGFRNPGGVGRMNLWYPAGNRFSNDTGRDPVRPATFFSPGSGIPTMSEMIAGQQVGVQKYNAIQQHIDRYGWPYGGMGFGLGFYGGYY